VSRSWPTVAYPVSTSYTMVDRGGVMSTRSSIPVPYRESAIIPRVRTVRDVVEHNLGPCGVESMILVGANLLAIPYAMDQRGLFTDRAHITVADEAPMALTMASETTVPLLGPSVDLQQIHGADLLSCWRRERPPRDVDVTVIDVCGTPTYRRVCDMTIHALPLSTVVVVCVDNVNDGVSDLLGGVCQVYPSVEWILGQPTGDERHTVMTFHL